MISKLWIKFKRNLILYIKIPIMAYFLKITLRQYKSKVKLFKWEPKFISEF